MKKLRKKRFLKYTFYFSFLVIISGYALPEHFILPVEEMNNRSFNHSSFWFYPWGASICHKGVDIFAPQGKEVYATTTGFVLNAGTHPRGGKLVLILGPKWRIHHFLHLDTIITKKYSFVHRGALIGRVGNSGNATHKPSHLHYAITTPIPYVWQADKGIQGLKKIWYLNPTPYLITHHTSN